jgi:carbon starvation protein
VNSVVALLLALLTVLLGYKFYAGWADRRVIRPSADRATPATMYMDGVDFVPTSKNVLFGYQFKSIAGAAPVVGAITAAQWGWLPALLWLLLGVFFIGWIHDYGSAMVSVREEGHSLGGLSHRLISARARVVLLVFVYFYLLLVAGAFGAIIASLLAAESSAAFGIIILTIAGVLAGQMIYRWKTDIILTSLVAVIIAIAGILAGRLVTSDLLAGPLAGSKLLWAAFAFLFCYLGATLPIWRFAQPVNYVSFYIVFLGLLLGGIGVFVGRPGFTIPAFTQPIIAIGPIWPILFVTIACGAVSGWHSLVSTSGTAKQLESEADARPVCAGSMFAETILGVLALITAAATFPSMSAYLEVMDKGAGAVFAVGLGKLMAYLGIPAEFGQTFGAVLIVILAITVMQLVLRFMRVATVELVGDRAPILRNTHVATIIACGLAFLLVSTGWWQYLWILFGGSNQLMASLALLVISVWLVTNRRGATFTLIPMFFMFITTIAALGYTSYDLLSKVFGGKLAGEELVGNALMGFVAVFLIVAAFILAKDGLAALQANWGKREEAA